jgi:hypothetical protein
MNLPVNGEPRCHLQLDPSNKVITLVAPYDTPEPDVARLNNISTNGVSIGDEDFTELTVRVEGNLHGAYSLLASIADGLQVEKLPLAAAVAAGVARHRNVVASRAMLTTEKEVGLFGELLFLEYLIAKIGATAAVAAWRGPESEEHDFTFLAMDVEIKTTTRERRQHTIHGLQQLVPRPGIELSLVSVQITRSSPESGRTLPQVIANVRGKAGGHRVNVDAMLDLFGFSEDDADLYTTFWALRSMPRSYPVDPAFPAMTSDLIGPVVPNFALVSDVTYRIDVSDLAPHPLPSPLTGFVEKED